MKVTQVIYSNENHTVALLGANGNSIILNGSGNPEITFKPQWAELEGCTIDEFQLLGMKSAYSIKGKLLDSQKRRVYTSYIIFKLFGTIVKPAIRTRSFKDHILFIPMKVQKITNTKSNKNELLHSRL